MSSPKSSFLAQIDFSDILALPSGAVEEIVSDGVSGYVCQLLDQMADMRVASKHSFARVLFGSMWNSTSLPWTRPPNVFSYMAKSMRMRARKGTKGQKAREA